MKKSFHNTIFSKIESSPLSCCLECHDTSNRHDGPVLPVQICSNPEKIVRLSSSGSSKTGCKKSYRMISRVVEQSKRPLAILNYKYQQVMASYCNSIYKRQSLEIFSAIPIFHSSNVSLKPSFYSEIDP